MVYHCCSAGCSANSKKMKNLQKYPWMAGLTWVKWPTDSSTVERWKKLIQNEDVLVSKHTRLCSRHFEMDALTSKGNAQEDPTLFQWNAWGTTTVLEVPDIGKEEWVPTPSQIDADVGELFPLEHPSAIITPCPTLYHDYVASSKVTSETKETQTDIMMDDVLVRTATRSDRSVQTSVVPTSKAEQMGEDVTNSNERVNFYTGIDNLALLDGVYNSLKDGASRMIYWKGTQTLNTERTSNRPGPKRSLSLYLEFLMTLIRLRLNLPLLLLSDLFGVSASLASQVTTTWIVYLSKVLVPATVKWPSKEQVMSRMPLNFQKHYPQTRVVIDCSEFYIETPANKDEQYKTYSQYKSHNTFKALIGVNPNGCFTFVSDLWSGNVSDRYITENSGFLDLIEKGDEVMADRGFRIEDLLLPKDAKLVAPPFTRKFTNGKGKRLNVNEIRVTRKIANLRIHVERAIQRLKSYRILSHTIPYSLKDLSSMVVKVVAALCNLKGPLFYTTEEVHLKNRVSRQKSVKRLKHGINR